MAVVTAVLFIREKYIHPLTWQYERDAVSADPSDASAGVPRWTFTGDVKSFPLSGVAQGERARAVLSDGRVRQLLVNEVSSSDNVWTITADSWLTLADAQPATYTGYEYGNVEVTKFPHYPNTSAISSYNVTWDPIRKSYWGQSNSLAPNNGNGGTTTVVNMGSTEQAYFFTRRFVSCATIWQQTKDWLAAHNCAIIDTGGTDIRIMPRGSNSKIVQLDPLSVSSSISTQTPEKNTSVRATQFFFYTGGGGRWYHHWNMYPMPKGLYGHQDPSVVSADARAFAVLDIQVPGYLPRMPEWYESNLIYLKSGVTDRINNWALTANYGTGIYSLVTGKDGYPISDNWWNSTGGAVTMQWIHSEEDYTTVRVTVQGADIERLSPFKLALTDKENDYPALFLSAGGQYVTETPLFWNAPAARQGSELETSNSLDNKNIVTADMAYMGMYYGSAERGSNPTLQWSGYAQHVINDIEVGHKVMFDRRYWIVESVTEDGSGIVQLTASLGNTLSDFAGTSWATPSTLLVPSQGITLGALTNSRIGERLE